MSTSTQIQIVNTILEQLGGKRNLKIMLGTEAFYSDNNGRTLVFDFKGSRKAKRCIITLNAMDLYDVEFYQTSRGLKKVAEYNHIDCEQLKPLFEDFTGLYLSL